MVGAVVGATQPDLTIIFDIPPDVGLRRAALRKRASENDEPDRFESMNVAFHRSLREEFLAIAKAEPNRCVVIDASQNTQTVENRVWSIVRERFGL